MTEDFHRGFQLVAYRSLQTNETGFSVWDAGALSDHPTREAAIKWIDDQFDAAEKVMARYLR